VWNYVYGGRIQGSDTYYRLYYLMNMVQVGKA
jgi:asparagine N-glycosylation enzyme membrane subunit Stt3